MRERPLRVVFDAHAVTPQRSGIGEYSRHLCLALIEHQRGEVELSVYARGAVTPVPDAEAFDRAVAGIGEGALYAASHQVEIPRLLARGAHDVFHSPDFYTSLLQRRIPLALTIHDVVPLALPDRLTRSKKTRLLPLLRVFMRLATRSAARIATDSAFSRAEITRLLGVPPSRIDVIPLGPTLVPSRAPLPADLAAVLPAGGYFLTVGRQDPYKGIALLLRAYREFLDTHPDNAAPLAIVGRPDPRYSVAHLIGELGLGRHVHFTGYVDADTLSALYANALALVFPSLYEGFGFPPLDAMAHGTPVLCSNRASLPEVTGAAALTFDPECTSDVANALRTILQDTTLRASLISEGLRRASDFTWERTARLTVDMYTHIVDMNGSYA